MASISIIYVPGKSPKPPPEVHRQYLWRCLRHGVLRHDSSLAGRLDAGRFAVAAWTCLYYGRPEPLDPDVPWIERLLEHGDATKADMRAARHWSKWLTGLLYSIGDHAHWLTVLLPDPRIRAMIQDTLRYFENTEGMADRIRDIHHDVYTAFRNTHGLNPHRCYGYLVHPEVGAVIGRWLRGDG